MTAPTDLSARRLARDPSQPSYALDASDPTPGFRTQMWVFWVCVT